MRERFFWIGSMLAWLLWLFQGWLAVPSVVARYDHSITAQAGPAVSCLPGGLSACQQETVLPLPDLQTLPPFDLQLIVNPSSGARVLRFSNSVANTGSGPLELRGEMDSKNQSVTLIQQINGADGTQLTQRLGGFDYHPAHNHWHWEGFSIYDIWSLGLNAELEEPVVNSGKVGYCMLDISPAGEPWLQANGLPGLLPAAQAYWQCGWQRQGISVGWVDTYRRHLPGQSMDVSTLSDGVYALRSTVDPEGLLAESNKGNNSALAYFLLEGSRMTVLKDARFARAHVFRTLYGDLPAEERLAEDRY